MSASRTSTAWHVHAPGARRCSAAASSSTVIAAAPQVHLGAVLDEVAGDAAAEAGAAAGDQDALAAQDVGVNTSGTLPVIMYLSSV